MNSTTCGGSGGGWSNGDSHDSGIGSSPPFDGIRGGISGMGGNAIISNGVVGGSSGKKYYFSTFVNKRYQRHKLFGGFN